MSAANVPEQRWLSFKRSNPLMMLIVCIIILMLAIPAEASSPKKTVKSPSSDVCEYVVSYANRGQLKQILIPSVPDTSSSICVPDSISSDVVFKRLMDINNDGILERVFITSEGSGHYENYYIFKLKEDEEIKLEPSPDDDQESDDSRDAAEHVFIRYRSSTYILGKTDMTLQYLEYINPHNKIKVLCEFDQKNKPFQRLKTSRNDKVCRLAQADHLQPVIFNRLHALSSRGLQAAGFWETHPGDKAAVIDINNDGKKEVVVSLELSSGSGRGCDRTFLGVLTADRTAIDKKMTEKLPAGGCGGQTVTPFFVDGKTYLDERQQGPHAEHRQIYMLYGDKLKSICKFEVRPVNYVRSTLEKIEKEAEANGMNPWEYAISKPGTNLLKALITAGRDVNELIDKDKQRPLDFALLNNRGDLLELLLKAGANPNLKDPDKYPGSCLADAVNGEDLKIVNLLLKYGAKDNDSAVSALCEAIWKGSLEMVELLLNSGIKITDSAAIEAVMGNNKDKHKKLTLLLRHGLDVNRNYTRDVVVEGIHREGEKVIIVGPDIKTQTVSKTLLQWAMGANDPETIKILVAAGAKESP